MGKIQPKGEKAEVGERMIQISIRFWTNKIANGKGRIVPKHAWSSGMVRMEANATHGIKPKKPTPFHSLMDINSAIEKVLVEHGIVLHSSRNARKYSADK
jgi:hypothetical protein